MKAILTSFGYVLTGPDIDVVAVTNKAEIPEARKKLAELSGYDPEDYACMEVFIKGWMFSEADSAQERLNQLPLIKLRGWDATYRDQLMNTPAIVPSAQLNKAIMDWGYRHSLMLTQAQIDDLIQSALTSTGEE